MESIYLVVMKNKIIKIIGIVVFLVLGKIYVPKLLNLTKNAQKRLNKKILLENYKGIITDKFIDKANHAQRVIVINDTVRFELYKREYYHYMEIGDSIIKIKKDYNINIVRNDSTYVFNLKMGNSSD